MKISVYHADPMFPRNGEQQFFDHVADVNVPTPWSEHEDNALEYAWRWTNNVEGSWSGPQYINYSGTTPVLDDAERNPDYNPNVKRHTARHVDDDGKVWGLRSSSVGDIFYVVDSKRVYRCSSFGFEDLSEPSKDEAAA